ncbi:hypothetical protein [Lacrimispora xylanolytica]|uniref:KAP NTPase domain-containing protein n=1 Tax=Lacrimispora xylanolytica TaxID=29375 RepID=A0ABY7A9Y2_9FIRM|nr:hypothetical protein [Lacrimispora xylanolytica]WAJ22341.1 hypothetical protein OW255_12220 [Lacrimispora xylanolytica]
MRRIIIEQGNEFKIYDSQTEISEDIFWDQYKMANEIKDSLVTYYKKIEADNSKKNIWEHLNNIIAFCGERGQGKSSAMIHFTYNLKNDDNIEVLETIDPTAMETVHDILDIVISRIFEQYRIDKAMNQNNSQSFGENVVNQNRDQLFKMSTLFQKVHKNLAVLKNSERFIKDEYIYNGSIQNLVDIADSMNLKNDVQVLVREYLKYRNKKILMVCLDDLDLNISSAYKMMEQIRKYMIIPELIIVMAVNIKQLTFCVERQFLLDMEGLEQSSRWDINLEAKNMANKYLEKLLPQTRRIMLPDIRTIASDGTSVVNILYRNGKKIIFDSHKLGIEKGLMNVLYKKTGLVLIAKEDEVHPLIPNTLRELVGMVSVIGNMGERDKKRNIDLFEDYLFDSWAENHLEEKERQWFVSLRQIGLKDVQAIIFIYLCKWLSNNGFLDTSIHMDILESSVQKEFELVMKERRRPNNGDIINCIRLCYRVRGYDLNNLLFAINTYISIIMLKLNYDNAKGKLQEFVGEDMFGICQLIREETGNFYNKSRLHYKYDVAEYWKRSIEKIGGEKSGLIDIANINVSAVRNYFNRFDNGEMHLKKHLYTIGCVSTFKWTKDSATIGMVSDNNMVATKADFSLNNLFIRQLDSKIVFNNISAEKWGIKATEELEQELSAYWKNFIELCNILICNMEAIYYIAQYLESTRDIKDRTNNDIKVYYNHFFKSLIEGLLQINSYIDLKIAWIINPKPEGDYSQLVNELAYFWESIKRTKQEQIDEELMIPILDDLEQVKIDDVTEIGDSFDKLISNIPSFVRKDSTVQNYKNKLNKLRNYYENNKGDYTVMEQAFLSDSFTNLNIELNNYIKNYESSDVINESLSKNYNTIRRSLMSVTI